MYKQIDLNYDFNSLEPYIDELTMITHYTKHHAAYTSNLNAAIEKLPEFSGYPIEDVLKKGEVDGESPHGKWGGRRLKR